MHVFVFFFRLFSHVVFCFRPLYHIIKCISEQHLLSVYGLYSWKPAALNVFTWLFELPWTGCWSSCVSSVLSSKQEPPSWLEDLLCFLWSETFSWLLWFRHGKQSGFPAGPPIAARPKGVMDGISKTSVQPGYLSLSVVQAGPVWSALLQAGQTIYRLWGLFSSSQNTQMESEL